jgi:hypothetical protein
MKIIEQLNKLPIKSGEYLVLPNLATPYFIIPIHSRDIFTNAISLVKPKNKKGRIKRIMLKFIPFFLLRKLFPIIMIQSKNCKNSYHQLILPWNQDVGNKFTIFNFNKSNVTLEKIGFGKYREMIRNEYNSILKVSKFGKNIIPEIIDFSDGDNFSSIETIFYKGNHPKLLPSSIIEFFENTKENSKKVKLIDHPYVNKIINEITKILKKEGLDILLDRIYAHYKKYENELIPIVLMHSDCSLTNVIECDKDNSILIDWEECIEDGVPIDIGYFDFRMHIDNGKSWKVETKIDFLVVLHYIYLQIKHNNLSNLNKISWNKLEVSVI